MGMCARLQDLAEEGSFLSPGIRPEQTDEMTRDMDATLDRPLDKTRRAVRARRQG